MRPFASNECIHAFGRRFLQVAAGTTTHNANAAAGLRASRDHQRLRPCGAPQPRGQIRPGDAGLSPKAKEQAVVKEEGTQLL